MTADERARRYRQRQRAAKNVLPVVLDVFDLAETLIDAGLLTVEQSTDKTQIAAVVVEIVERWKKTVTRDGLN